jgi:Gly-Xaa carboxypeptidase
MAIQLALLLLKRDADGDNAFELIVDEGGGFSDQEGGVFAVPGVAEKGYLDVRVTIHTPGGHSSIPPAHTSIGILSRLLVEYERNPYTPKLYVISNTVLIFYCLLVLTSDSRTRGTTVYKTVQCLGEYAPELPSKLRDAIKKSPKSDKALAQVEKFLFEAPQWRALVGTTQAIDLIHGGVKSNALPEESWAVVNHRIDIARCVLALARNCCVMTYNVTSSVDAVKKSDTALLKSLAQQFNLSYTAFGEKLTSADAPSYGSLELADAWGTALEPAPVTPIDGAAYKLLAGTIKATYDHHRADELHKQDIVVAPGIMTGNTGAFTLYRRW